MHVFNGDSPQPASLLSPGLNLSRSFAACGALVCLKLIVSDWPQATKVAPSQIVRSRTGQSDQYLNSPTRCSLGISFPFLLHTYLVSKSLDHELGTSVWMACIAQRGVDPCSIVLRGHRRRNFCLPTAHYVFSLYPSLEAMVRRRLKVPNSFTKPWRLNQLVEP